MLTAREIRHKVLQRHGITPQRVIYDNGFRALTWQEPVLSDQSFILLLTGSAGGGKSRLGLELLNRYMLNNKGATGLMMRKAREWTGKSIVPFMKQAVINRNPDVVMKKSDSLFQYPENSILYWGGMKDDDQRESIRSIGGDGGLDIVLFEEANAFTEDDLNEIIGRMRGKAGDYRQIILMTNPDAPNHWINQRLILGGEAAVYYSGALDNPHNPPEYIENLQRMTGILYERLVLGHWVQAEGVIFDNFSPEFNVSEDAEYNPNFPVLWGVDDGYVHGNGPGHANYHPRVILFGQPTAIGGMNIFDTYIADTELSEISIKNALVRHPDNDETPYKIPDTAYIDSSAQELRQRIWDAGINTISSTHPVHEGIKNLRRFIGDNLNPRLFKVHPRCRQLINEFQSYRYDPDSRVANVGEPKPLTVDDHCPSAARYLMWHLRYE